MADFSAFNLTTHPIISVNNDWNTLLSHGLHVFTGYIVKINGSYYEALNASTKNIVYGGADNAGGVDGTSATDVLQAVIDAIDSNPGYGRIHISAGTYTISGLHIKNGSTVTDSTQQWIEISGDGMGATILQGDSSEEGASSDDVSFTDTAWLMIDSYDTSGIRVHLHDFQIFGDHGNNTNNVAGIIVRYGRNSIIERVWVRQCSKYGIYQVGPNAAYREAYIRDCIIYDINDNDGTPSAPIESTCCGIKSTFADLYITNNIIGWIGHVVDTTDSLGYGIVMEDSTIADGNIIWVAAAGIFTLGDSSDQIIINNFIDYTYVAGIYLYNVDRVTCHNNTMRIPYQYGIFLSGATKCSVQNNSFILRSGTTQYTTTGNGNVGGTTVVNTNDNGADNYCKNRAIRLTSGAYSGETRVISAFDTGTGTYTVESAFSGQVVSGVTYYVDYASDIFIAEGGASDENVIMNNNCSTDGTVNTGEIATVATGSTSSFKNNSGHDFLGGAGTWFDNVNNTIGVQAVSAAVPSASTDYTVINSGIYVNSTDSGNTDCAIIIKAPNGSQVNLAAMSTINWMYIPEGYIINWGAYTGDAPTVVITFR